MTSEEAVLVVELTPEELEAQLREEEQKRQDIETNLANCIETQFQERASRRGVKELQWLRAAGLYYGALAIGGASQGAETPFQNTNRRRRPDINIVRAKCNTAIAQTVSMQFGTGNKNWDIEPAANAVSKEAWQTAGLMEQEISAQLDRSKWSAENRKAMWDRVVMGTGVMKGPVNTGTPVRTYVQLEGSTTWAPSVGVDRSPAVIRVNPWFFYPDETVQDSCKIEDTIELHPMSAIDLKAYLKHDGFMAENIRQVLEEKPKEYYSTNWKDFASLTDSNPYLFDNKYLVLEYHGPIKLEELQTAGITPSYESEDGCYYGEVWVCQGKVIRVELENIEASFSVPYYMCPWERDPSSVFGFGVPLMMEDAQRVVNQSWHMILDNSSLSSGPQVALQKHLIEPASGDWSLTPGNIWHLTDPTATVQQAIQFFDVPNVVENLTPVLNMAMNFAEEESCIPLLAAGLQSPQVADTATGSAIMMQASTTLLDFMSEEWDDKITSPAIENMVAWNMQYSPKPEIKGNFTVDVRTSTEYKNKQLHIRDLEKLSVEAATNPEVGKAVDIPTLTRARLEMMHLPSKGIVKTIEQMAEEEANAQPQPDPAMLKLQLEERELTLKEAELAFKAKQQQQVEAWDHEERMSANQARLVEAQARVAVASMERETELIKLSARDREMAQRLMADKEIARENNQTKAFVAGMQESRKQQENELYKTEMELKASYGSGI